MEVHRLVKQLEDKIRNLEHELESMRKHVRDRDMKIRRLERQINCVRNHPEIKPVHCCWMADSILLREYEKDKKKKNKENTKQEGVSVRTDIHQRPAVEVKG